MSAARAAPLTPLAPVGVDGRLERVHSVRICDDDGDCWWSNRPRGRYEWDDNYRWRHGWRDRDDDYYGRGERRRDWDRDEHGRYERYDRDGYSGDRDEWGRSDERERHAREADRDRSAHDETSHGMKERGGGHTPGGQTGPEPKKD